MNQKPLAGEVLTPDTMFQGYSPPAGRYDELLEPAGAFRDHWRPFVVGWHELGVDELARRWTEAQRLLRENGITYTIHGDAADIRPWDVDMFPLVLPADQWRELSAGIVQRARLLDFVVRDVYSAGQLLSRRVLPPELVLANPGFLRACHGQPVPADCYLHFYAVDLVRTSDGQWRAVADRTDAPLGVGYTLENRIAFARMFPGMIRMCWVERLAPFFIALQQAFRDLAPRRRENPRIVLLSEGPGSFHYFEDAYLARYLNYTLAEAGDLTVRDGQVLLKTLGGLLAVDVVLRRLADRLCDPLELQGDSTCGVPGLLQAVRAGNVAVVNALGTSLLEAPALLSCLPALCRTLFGEELRLPSVETVWSGTPDGRRHLVQRADELLFYPAFPGGEPPVVPPDGTGGLTSAQVEETLRRAPFSLVGRSPFQRSTAPVWDAGGVRPAPVSLRVFAVRTGDTYQVLPGGLVRVVPGERVLEPSISAGEASKDAWIVAETEVPEVSLLRPPGESFVLRRGGAELPSRVADNMFWLGRYVERADTASRLMRTLVVRLADESQADSSPELIPLLRTLAAEGYVPAEAVTDEALPQSRDLSGILVASLLDASQPASLSATLRSLDRTSNLVRDRLSLDGCKILNGLHQAFLSAIGMDHLMLSDLLLFLDRAIRDLAAFGGLAAESMTRSQSWRFMDLGRRLERSLHILALVRNFLARDVGEHASLLETLLEVGDSLMTYRSRYLANLRLAPVLDLLLTDETNPRSLAYQLAAIEEHVANLPRDESQALLGPERRLALNLLNHVRQVDVAMLESRGRDGKRSGIDRLLVRLASQLPRLSELVMHKYFVHAGSPRQLAERRVTEDGDG